MSVLVKCLPSHLQFGDQIIILDYAWTVMNIVGPDKIGTYDLSLKDSFGNERQEIVTEPVTILL